MELFKLFKHVIYKVLFFLISPIDSVSCLDNLFKVYFISNDVELILTRYIRVSITGRHYIVLPVATIFQWCDF